jgi:hypothetical protein
MTAERFPVEATHILMFARAIGDPNPVYSDPESDEAKRAGGIVAPPTFPMAAMQFDPENPLLPKPGQAWFGSGREATGGMPSGDGAAKGGLHAEQSFTYAKPIRPGMVLKGVPREGKTWVKESKRGGSLEFSEGFTDYFDQDGELVVTARMVGVVPSLTPTKEA